MTLDHEDIAAIAAEVAKLLAPLLSGKVLEEDSAARAAEFVAKHGDPNSFAARRAAALSIAEKKGCLPRQRKH